MLLTTWRYKEREMAYTPTEWVSGTIISASKLNNIERGVESVNSEYTPTTWVEGDTVTAAKLNKIEQGIANASSDFSTAEVTLNQTTTIYGAFVIDGRIYMDNQGLTSCTLVIGENGSAIEVFDEVVSVSGDITGSANAYLVTGDCTITISDGR